MKSVRKEEKEWTPIPRVLTIAGSDCSGGAGMQADLKTFLAHGVYGMSIITALTAQNTMGVLAIHNLDAAFLGKQFEAVFTDIVPDAVKIGMVSSAWTVRVIAEELSKRKARHIVVDPVMVATSGARLMEPEAERVLVESLLPLAEVITPNRAELEVLSGCRVDGRDGMRQAAQGLCRSLGTSVLAKGGHIGADADDLLVTPDGEEHWYPGERIDNADTHGTGCTLSSAIASNLAKGMDLDAAVGQAKAYLAGALRAGLHIGHGSGPLNHAYRFSFT